MNQEKEEFEQAFNQNTKTFMVYKILSDMEWHCRECEYTHTGITQIAGGAGIQGLQRGNKNRYGMEIHSGNHLCKNCDRTTRHDKWTGNFIEPLGTKTMSRKFVMSVMELLNSRDIIENVKRSANELTIDHKLPMLRWSKESEYEQTNYGNMTDNDILDKFQLLKKSNGSVSHNLLKSRSCEECWKKGKRGKPFGIDFYYSGNERWEAGSNTDKTGCVGCGWYDFDKWRDKLNDPTRR